MGEKKDTKDTVVIDSEFVDQLKEIDRMTKEYGESEVAGARIIKGYVLSEDNEPIDMAIHIKDNYYVFCESFDKLTDLDDIHDRLDKILKLSDDEYAIFDLNQEGFEYMNIIIQSSTKSLSDFWKTEVSIDENKSITYKEPHKTKITCYGELDKHNYRVAKNGKTLYFSKKAGFRSNFESIELDLDKFIKFEEIDYDNISKVIRNPLIRRRIKKYFKTTEEKSFSTSDLDDINSCNCIYSKYSQEELNNVNEKIKGNKYHDNDDQIRCIYILKNGNKLVIVGMDLKSRFHEFMQMNKIKIEKEFFDYTKYEKRYFDFATSDASILKEGIFNCEGEGIKERNDELIRKIKSYLEIKGK